MTGDIPDIVARIKTVLPTRWFPDETPVLDSVLAGLANAWSGLYSLLGMVRQQSRIATASDQFLDGASTDFFGSALPRRSQEPDSEFRVRIQKEMVRDRATRAAVTSVLTDLTGRAPVLFEPARIADTGAYATPSFAYGAAGAWGSFNLPFQVFVTARRPQGAAIANIAGYGTPGPIARANLSMVSGQVTDADIYAAIASVMPTASTAWTSITN